MPHEQNKPVLEACVAVLDVLNKKGNLPISKIATFTRIRSNTLGKYMSILAEEGLLEKEESVSSNAYRITEGGKNVLTFFKMDNTSECKNAIDL